MEVTATPATKPGNLVEVGHRRALQSAASMISSAETSLPVAATIRRNRRMVGWRTLFSMRDMVDSVVGTRAAKLTRVKLCRRR